LLTNRQTDKQRRKHNLRGGDNDHTWPTFYLTYIMYLHRQLYNI